MDLAYCTLDRHSYRAEEFTSLPPDRFAALKPWLVCLDCGAKVTPVQPHHRSDHYRGQPRHAIGCKHRTEEREQITAPLPGGYDPRHVGRGIVLLVEPEAAGPGVNVVDDPTATTDPGRARRHHPGDGEGTGAHRYALDTMLELLLERPDVAVSAEPITVGNQTVPCHRFFTTFDDVAADHVGRFGGYWGPVESIGHRRLYSWVNTAGASPDVRVAASARAKARRVEVVLGDAAMLVVGTPELLDNGQVEIRIADEHLIALAGRGAAV